MTADRPLLDRSFSLYLDLVRFLAAVLVVLTHLVQCGVVNDWQARLLPFAGREAVIVFFVLSGFVIAYAIQSKTVTMGQYLVARLARIYSVALPVLLVAFIVAAALNARLGGASIQVYQLEKAYIYVPIHLMFMGEFWTLSETPPLLSAYWSLSHEVWYYVLFGAAFYLRGPLRFVVCGLVAALMGHKLLLLLPVWGAGVALFYWLESHTIPQRLARLGWILSLTILIAYNVSGLEQQLKPIVNDVWPFPGIKLGSGNRVLGDYLVCCLVVINFACARFAGFSGLKRFAPQIRKTAFFTFSLYLAHALVFGAWRVLRPAEAGSLGAILSVTLLTGIFTWVLGHAAEFMRLRMLTWFDSLHQGLAKNRLVLRTYFEVITSKKRWSRIREGDFDDPFALPPESTKEQG